MRSPKARAYGNIERIYRRIIKEKNLKVIEIQRRSGGNIKDSYITSLLNGETTNPSIEKLKALAVGLGVDEDEIFLVARGIEVREWTPRTLLFTMDQIVASPELTRIVKALTRAKPAETKQVKKILKIE